MQTFFNSWRRKAGSAMLLMAAILMIAWGRSHFHEDHVWFASSRERACAIHTAIDQIAISTEWQDEGGRPGLTTSGLAVVEIRFDPAKCFNWVKYPADDQLTEDSWGVTHWYLSWGRFGCGEWDDGTLGFRLLVIPYWLLVLPLSLLSAHLILWKPHRILLNTKSAINA